MTTDHSIPFECRKGNCDLCGAAGGLKADRIGGQSTNGKTTYDPMICISTPEHMAYPETVKHFHSKKADQREYLTECVRPTVLAARTLKYPKQENTQPGHTEIPRHRES